ncbi:hypothetical protein [Streptomyces somaliensis]|nr:hypothetical protein [Streptomyces somaliensis]
MNSRTRGRGAPGTAASSVRPPDAAALVLVFVLVFVDTAPPLCALSGTAK